MASEVRGKGPNGVVYVYSNESYWDKKDKKTKHRRKCIGHVDPETGQTVPNGPRGRKKGDSKAEATESHEEHIVVESPGPGLLLGKVSRELKLPNVLQEVFPDDWEVMLGCAYYIASEGEALYKAEKWCEEFTSPCSPKAIASQRISELLPRITEAKQKEFFQKWMKLHMDSCCALDITSVSSYSELLNFLDYGYNRDHEKLPQINMLLVAGMDNDLPLYMRILPGKITDVTTIDKTMKDLDILAQRGIRFTMDKGFYSETNIDAMYNRHYKFCVGVPFSASFAKELVDQCRETIQHHDNLITINNDVIYGVTITGKWKGHRCYRHVYFDSEKFCDDRKKFDLLLRECYDELKNDEYNKNHEKFYKKYFFVKKTPKRGISVQYNEEAIQDAYKNQVGWFVMISNYVRDASEGIRLYRLKDTVEKNFDDLKNAMDMKRLRICSDPAMHGRIFLQLLGLALMSELRCTMKKHEEFRNLNVHELIAETKSVRRVSIGGTRKKYTTELTPMQRAIRDAFGIPL